MSANRVRTLLFGAVENEGLRQHLADGSHAPKAGRIVVLHAEQCLVPVARSLLDLLERDVVEEGQGAVVPQPDDGAPPDRRRLCHEELAEHLELPGMCDEQHGHLPVRSGEDDAQSELPDRRPRLLAPVVGRVV